MKGKSNLSVNILRDENAGLDYIPTLNTQRIVDQILADFQIGIRSFNVIGSYGTGKSSFLWAVAQDLKQQKDYFGMAKSFSSKVQVLPFIGEYTSFREFMAKKFLAGQGITDEEIFAEIFHRFHKLRDKNGLLVLMVDEFGKFLEYAAKNSPEKELYFIQQMAEFVNNPEYNILLLTTLHQNFDAYAFSLNSAQRLEWSKVKGRFREVTFNEPVEQLLQLASKKLSQGHEFKPEKASVRKTAELFAESKPFAVNTDLIAPISIQLYPLDIFSGASAALALQRYGQNERSLFSFLESTGYTSIRGYDTRQNPFFNLSNLYDYLTFNFYSFLNSKYNPDNGQWSAIKSAIERAESAFEGNTLRDCIRMIKSIGLLNTFASRGAKLDDYFWINYAATAVGIDNPEHILKSLYDRKIILLRKYERRIILFEGTDVDIQSALLLAGDQVGEIGDLVGRLNKYFSFAPIFAKASYYKTGTPRIFEFVLSSYPETNLPLKGDVDGFINIVFNEKISEVELKKTSGSMADRAIVYGYFRDTKMIRDLVWEIEKTQKTKENIDKEDRIAQRELNNILQHQEALLNHYLLQCIYSPKGQIGWYFGGQEFPIKNKREFNVWLSEVCDTVYADTPIYKNELVNRSKLSSQIQTAKRAYLKHLVLHWGEENLGFTKDRFPPERTIFLTLLKENGLMDAAAKPSAESSFNALWDYCEGFLEGAKKHRRPLSELVEGLLQPPYKLKQGLIEFWLPTFVFLKRDSISLFADGVYLPFVGEEALELLVKRPKDYTVKKFDVEGIRLEFFNEYRRFLHLPNKESVNTEAYIETIRPFLTFYRQLPQYSKTTNRLQKESIAVRNAIAKATDPEKTFFEDLPQALGLTLNDLQKSPSALSAYIERLQDAVREIRSCYDELVDRFEFFLTSEVLYANLEFEAYKIALQDRFPGIKTHLLLPHHKTFLLRISSALDDRKAWLSSIAQAVIGRSLENLRDEDEHLLYDKFKSIVVELDTLTEMTQGVADPAVEEAIGVEITLLSSTQKGIVKFPSGKKDEVKHIENSLRSSLGKDITLNIAALANLLNELLRKPEEL